MRVKLLYRVTILATIMVGMHVSAYGLPPMTPDLQWKGRIVVEFSEMLGSIQVDNEAGIAKLGENNLDDLAVSYNVYNIEKLFPNVEKPANSGIRDLTRFYIVEFPPATDLHVVADAYQSNPHVITAEPYQIHQCLYTPSDPSFSNQWALNHVGAETAYDYSRGSRDITIGIIDIGIDTTHEDLRDNLWINPGEDLNQNGIIEPAEWNGIDDDQNGYVDDFWGWNLYQSNNNVQEANPYIHGTSCSGAASAVTDNNTGIASLGYQTPLMIAKAGDGDFIYNAMEGVMYCVENGADVITMSFGSMGYSSYEQSVMEYAWFNGVAVFAAAGQGGASTPFYPAAYDCVVGVGSTDQWDHMASFNSPGDWISIYAPGVNMLLTSHGSNYEYLSGTSFSCPMAAGLASLIWSADPTFTNDQVVQQILTTAVNIDSLNPGNEGLLRIDAGAAVSGVFLSVSANAVNPPIIIPPNGGDFDYIIEISNQDTASHNVDYWSDIVIPDGSHFGPVLGPFTLTINGSTGIARPRSLSIPSRAPSGDYLLVAYAGSYPSSICSRDTIPFVKQGSGDSNTPEGFVNSGWNDRANTESLPISDDLPINVAPNPFNPTTVISFDLPAASQVRLDVYDVWGRNVLSGSGATPTTEFLVAGKHSINFDGSELASGVYFYRLTTVQLPGSEATPTTQHLGSGKLVLLK